MIQRGGRGQFTRNARSAGGLYGSTRRPPSRRQLLLGALGIGALVLFGFLAFSWFTGGGCSKPYCPSNKDLKAPDGFELVTKIYQLNKSQGAVPQDKQMTVQLPLLQPTTDGRNLNFYRYVASSDTWEPITTALLDAQGKIVSASFDDRPDIMAAMRRQSAAGQVVAYLQHNAPLNKDAVGQITILHTFDFKPASDGTVTGELSTTVKPDASFAFYPVISASLADRGSIPIVAGIFSNAQSRSNHVQQIVKKVNDLQLKGIDIAYLDLPADQRTSFALFIGELAQTLHTQGKMLTVTVPCPLQAQDRIDDGAYDWAALGAAADVLEIAPYRDQSDYRSVVPAVLQYLTGLVNPNKLVLTVSPYATEKAPDGIRTLALTEAMSIASSMAVRTGTDNKLTTNSNVDVVGVNIDKSENLSGLIWQPQTATVAFTYKLNGGRTVWLENFFSIGFKLEFISRFKLGGVAVEDASQNDLLGDIWPALTPFIASGQPILMQPNPADLVPKWTASKGTLDGGQRGSVKWTTPSDPGNYTVDLTLSDGVSLFQNEISVNVQPKDNAAPRTTNPGSTPGTSAN